MNRNQRGVGVGGLLVGLLAAALAWEGQAATTESTAIPLSPFTSVATPAPNDQAVVALDGDTLVVGTPYENPDAANGLVQGGRAYVYLRVGANWSQQAELIPSPDDRGAFDHFGGSVAVSGNTAVVSARRANDDRGAVYVFTRSGSSWTLGAKLSGGNGPGDFFGTAVAISAENTIVVGAAGLNASYVFTGGGSNWTLKKTLTASGGVSVDRFGCSVAVTSGDAFLGFSALIGAPGKSVNGFSNAGAAYVFKSADATWSAPTQSLLSWPVGAGNDDAYLGSAVSLYRGVALLGAPGEAVNALPNAGAGHVAYYSGSAWTALERPATMTGSTANAKLGTAVKLAGDQADLALLGSPGAQGGQGAAYLVTRDGSASAGAAWNAAAANPLVATNADPSERLGSSVALWGDTAIAASAQLGAVFGYRFDCGLGRYWPVNTWLFPSLPCVPAGTSTVGGQFAGSAGRTSGNFGQYYPPSVWFAWTWNASTQALVAATMNTPLVQGGGLELITLQGARIGYTAGTATPLVYAPLPHCANGCFAIPVVAPATTSSASSVNLVGHPFPYPVDWADVRILDVTTGQVYTPAAAHAANIFNKSFRIWNGAANETYDDSTPGMAGNLWPNQSVWVWVKPGSAGHTIRLLIPAQPSRQNARAPAEAPRLALPGRVLDGLASVIGRVVDFVIPSAMAAPANTSHAAERDAVKQQHKASIGRGEEWYVQLLVQTADGTAVDKGHSLGQLSDASNGFDNYDVEALATPVPPGAMLLSLVFPHPEWKREAGDYASDFHRLQLNQDDSWSFEVRSSKPGAYRLRWQATNGNVLALGQLVDDETGAVINVAARDYYDFTLTKARRSFHWYYLGKSGKPGK